MLSKLPMVSFVIPAKNEESMLPITIDSIQRVVGDDLEYEIIVVDNGSHDNTVAVAKSKGARVLHQNTGTIGGLRNCATKIAKGECLVFIDADVSLTDSWLEPFIGVLKSMRVDENFITGSRCSTDDSAGWVAKSWFRRAPSLHVTTHVGTGHMIMSKALFDRLGGFDEKLMTGEDYEFCARAKRKGASIFENHALRVIHYGVPRTLGEFIRREIWHGTGDVQSIGALIRSKVAVLSLIFLVAHLWLIANVVFGNGNVMQSFAGLSIIITVVVASAWKKYHYATVSVILRNIILYYFYFWARSISILNRVIPFISLRTPRAGRSN